VSGIRLADHRSPLAALNGENSRAKSRVSVNIAPLTGISLRVCPACRHGEMIIIERLVPASRAGFVNPDTS
jgi:hypothetical protein